MSNLTLEKRMEGTLAINAKKTIVFFCVFSPVKTPFEEELPGVVGEVCAVCVGLEHPVHQQPQPVRPVLQRTGLREGLLEVLLQPQHELLVTTAHPTRLQQGGGLEYFIFYTLFFSYSTLMKLKL